MDIIIDRKRKKAVLEFNEPDPMGTEQAKRNRLNELPIDPKADNPVDKYLCQNTPKSLIGKRAYALKGDKVIEGFIVDVYTARFLLMKCKGENRPFEFESVISISND